MAFEMIEKYRIYECKKGDVKKTTDIEVGSFLFETDSGFRYIFDGTSWVNYPENVQIAAKNESGTFVNMTATKNNNPKVTDAESYFNIAQGNVVGTSVVSVFGNAPDFDSGGFATVWDGANDAASWNQPKYVYSTIADIDRISSNNPADNQQITIIGLNGNYEEVIQNITLNGQTPVPITPLLRVNKAYNNDSTNVLGYIFVFVNVATTGGVPNASSNIRCIIDPENQESEMAIYTIPANKTGYILKSYIANTGNIKTTGYVARGIIREFGKVFRVNKKYSVTNEGNSFADLEFIVPLSIPEKTDLEIDVNHTVVNITGSNITGGFHIILVDN